MNIRKQKKSKNEVLPQFIARLNSMMDVLLFPLRMTQSLTTWAGIQLTMPFASKMSPSSQMKFYRSTTSIKTILPSLDNLTCMGSIKSVLLTDSMYTPIDTSKLGINRKWEKSIGKSAKLEKMWKSVGGRTVDQINVSLKIYRSNRKIWNKCVDISWIRINSY